MEYINVWTDTQAQYLAAKTKSVYLKIDEDTPGGFFDKTSKLIGKGGDTLYWGAYAFIKGGQLVAVLYPIRYGETAMWAGALRHGNSWSQNHDFSKAEVERAFNEV